MHRTRLGSVLIAMPTGRDAALAAETLAQVGLQIRICPDLASLTAAVDDDTATILLAEEALTSTGFDALLNTLRQQSPWSDLPILFLNSINGYSQGQPQRNHRLLETTFVTLLDRPLRRATLISAVQAALRARQRQWQVKDLLEQKIRAQEELMEAKQQAETANRSKDNFLAALSHELRTPLTPALMTVATLRNDERLPADAREDLGVVERNIALESRLIDDLLDLTRISTGKLTLRPELCDAHSLLAHAVEIVRDDAQSKGVRMGIDLQASQSGLRVDAARFQQVAWNLLKNAVKFTPQGGQVTAHTFNKDGHLVLEVADTGIGFDPLNAEKIFRPFEQAGREGHAFGGLGLGLAISRAIVELHGGEIAARSEGLQHGAVFEVALPGACEPPMQMCETITPHGPAPLAEAPPRLKLLLVEDHAATLAVLTRLLLRAGHHVTTATTVAEAVECVETSTDFDILITDLGLPDGTGIDVMTQVRQHLPELPGIVLSGYGMEEDLNRTLSAGFYAHLVKPVSFVQLQRAIQNHGVGVAG